MLFVGGLFSAYAQDMLVLKDGNIIEAKVMEISPTEIRYKRFDHLDGPTIVVSRTDILSIRYENGKVDIFNQSGQTNPQAVSSEGTPQLSPPNPLQNILNTLPAITIAGNTLKFEFGGDSWVSRVNGENFSAGTIAFEESATGGMLTLKQTHIWPDAIGKTAGKVANAIPGGGQVGNVLNTAGNVAGVLGPVEAPGTEIILEYKAGPPASLRFVKQRKTAKAGQTEPSDKVANVRNNWLSIEPGYTPLFGIPSGVRYERMLNSNLSWGVNVNLDYNYIKGVVEGVFRWYPWGKTFFMGTALGYVVSPCPLGAITPEIGWKIDVAKTGGFYLEPGIACSFLLGEPPDYLASYPFIFPRIYFGMGRAW